MDPSGRWWSDDDINWHIEAWQDEVQRDLELVWGTTSTVLSTSTISLGTLSPEPLRLDAVYLNGFRLAGRNLAERDSLYTEWRVADPATPRMVLMPDSTKLVLWPPIVTSGTLVLEYPQKLSFSSDASVVSLPEWAQYSAKPYVCSKLYLRPGPTNDRNKSMRYWKLYQDSLQRTKDLWGNFLPERFRRLKPGGRYEIDILNPPSGWETSEVLATVATFSDEVPSGTINGTNPTFTLSVTPTEVQVFKNGVLLKEPDDYSLSGYTITFVASAIPQTGDSLVAWVYRA